MNHEEQDGDRCTEEVSVSLKEQGSKFYDVLRTEWDNEDDIEKLRDAVLTILQELRGNEETEGTAGDPSQLSEDVDVEDESDEDGPLMQSSSDEFVERAKYIPLRLHLSERKIQRIVENCLMVSEYTDRVDQSGSKRMHLLVKAVYAVLSGVATGVEFEAGRDIVTLRDFTVGKDIIAKSFEIARRYRLANPELLRVNYAKLIHVLQDTMLPEVQSELGFSCVMPITTAYSYLEGQDAVELLRDPLVEVATKEIIPDGKTRSMIRGEIRDKERAVERLAKKYKRSSTLKEEDIRHTLYSIADNSVYLRFARDPCDEMIKYLVRYFSPDDPTVKEESLAIMSGRGGARLTHDHHRQYNYVLQTLWLWREVLNDMYKLLYLAEQDLLSQSDRYTLRNTGQGLNRVQRAPRLKREMEQIVKRVRRRVPSWVGSDVVHLGDHNVPNALMFVDKYAQVPRILLPLTTTLRLLDRLEDGGVLEYVKNTFGSIESAKREILRDFYRHAFDGSGADNFFDAGSCIDGRLTSAWHWCNELEQKRFYALFRLTGFVGFDSHFT